MARPQGHDTTTAALNWVIMLLGNHPECQAKVHAELDDIFGDDDRDPTFEDVSRMKSGVAASTCGFVGVRIGRGVCRYIECCVKEALRLYPSVPLFARVTSGSLNISG